MQKLRDWLYIGNYADLVSDNLKNHDHINAVLNFAEDLDLTDKKSLFINIDDGVPISENNIFKGVEFSINAYIDKKVLLIACGAGVSRSAAYCTMMIKEIENRSLIDSFREVKKLHTKALPHPEIWKSICDAYQETFDYTQVLDIITT